MLVLSLTHKNSTGLRCSSFALSMASSVFKDALAAPVVQPPPATDSSATSSTSAASSTSTGRLIPLPEDDGDALLLILYILHFRHQNLPAYIQPDALIRIGVLANKYRCTHAISRATTQWFDRIFTGLDSSTNATNAAETTLLMIQAAFILDEATYFARFTGRYVRTTPKSAVTISEELPAGVKRIKTALQQRQAESFAALRLDLDLLLEPCAVALGRESHHNIDGPPNMEMDPEELPLTSDGEPGKPVVCAVDSQAAPLYLGALRDAGLWPPAAWGARTVGQLITAVERFREPEYDDCDKCEFCLPLVESFEQKLTLVKKLHGERLWGICLDCFSATAGVDKAECRFAHVKASVAQK
jgi:hypothetical protein